MLVSVGNLDIFYGNILTRGLTLAFVDDAKGAFSNLRADDVALSEPIARR